MSLHQLCLAVRKGLYEEVESILTQRKKIYFDINETDSFFDPGTGRTTLTLFSAPSTYFESLQNWLFLEF